MTIKDLDALYKKQSAIRKLYYKLEPNPILRFFKYFWYILSFPYIWVFYNIRDWHTAIIFILVLITISSCVWLPLLLGIIFNSPLLLGIATTCELFWLSPFTPFLLLCIFITMAIKELLRKLHKPKD